MLSAASTLAYLETIFRHHRHHDLSIRLVTQTVDEFCHKTLAERITEARGERLAIQRGDASDNEDTTHA